MKLAPQPLTNPGTPISVLASQTVAPFPRLTVARPSWPTPSRPPSSANSRGVNTFRMNTCKSASKQRTLTIFRMNTCEKTGGGGVMVNLPATNAANSPSPKPIVRCNRTLHRLCAIGSPHRFGAIRSPYRLGAIRRIDADILRREIARPVARAGRAGMQVHHDGHMVR